MQFFKGGSFKSTFSFFFALCCLFPFLVAWHISRHERLGVDGVHAWPAGSQLPKSCHVVSENNSFRLSKMKFSFFFLRRSHSKGSIFPHNKQMFDNHLSPLFSRSNSISGGRSVAGDGCSCSMTMLFVDGKGKERNAKILYLCLVSKEKTS